MDDMVIFGKNEDDHSKHLLQALQVTRVEGISTNRKNGNFFFMKKKSKI